MKPGNPWSLGGVDPEVREAALHAARRSGLSLGDWLKLAVQEMGPDQGYSGYTDSGGNGAARAWGSHSEPEIDDRLNKLSAELSRLSRQQNINVPLRETRHGGRVGLADRQPGTASGGETRAAREAAAEYLAFEGALEKIVDQIETTEHRHSQTLGQIQERLADLQRKANDGHAGKSHQDDRVLDTLESRIAELAERIEHAESGPNPMLQQTERQIADLAARLEQAERRPNDTADLVDRQIAALSQRLDQAEHEPARGNGFSEQRFSELTRRLEQAERQSGSPGAFQSIESRVADLAEQVQNHANRASSAAMQAQQGSAFDVSRFASRNDLQTIQNHINDIVSRLDNSSTHVPDVTLIQMQREIAALSQNLSDLQINTASSTEVRSLKQAIDNISAQLKDATSYSYDPTPAITRIQDEVVNLSQSIADLTINASSPQEVQSLRQSLEEIRQQLQQSGTGVSGQGSSQLHEEVAALSAMIAQIRAEAASADEVRVLRDAIEQISAHIEASAQSGQDPNRFQSLEYRLNELSNRLDQSLSEAVSMGQIAALEARLQDLDASIGAASPSANDPQLQHALESQLTALSERLVAAEQSNVGFNERIQSIQLADQSLTALERGLQTVQTNAEFADKRTQETLEAVHETLEKVVNRLAFLENNQLPEDAPMSDAVAGARAALAASLDRSSERFDPTTRSAEVRMPPVSDFNAGPTTGAPDIRLEPIRQSAPGAVPLTPASNSGQGGEFNGLSGITRTDDFIAAARRAAQSAAPAPAEPQKQSRFNLNLLSRGSRKSAQSDGNLESRSQAKDAKSGKKRTILLAAAAALLAISAVSTMTFFEGRKAPILGNQTAPEKTSQKSVKPDSMSPATAKTNPAQSGSTRPRENSRMGDVDRPINPQAVPASAPRAALGSRTPVTVSDVAKTSDTAGRVTGIPGSDLSRGAAPATTGSIPRAPASTGIATGAGSTSRAVNSLLSRSKTQGATASANTATRIQTQTNTPAPAPRIQGLGSISQSLPPAEIGPMGLRVAAASGNANAQFEVAARYTEGKIVEQDFRKAAYWYQKSAAKGLAPAQYRLGTFYEKGRGVPQDRAAARIWYERAAEKGNAKAMHNLAVIYANPPSGNPNFAKAAVWFRNAAELGLSDSQFNLGILNERGLGVPKNIAEAYKWFSIAAQNGDRGARDRLSLTEAKIDSDALLRTKLDIETWTPKDQDRSANVVTSPKGGWGSRPVVSVNPDASVRMIADAQTLLNSMGYQAGPPDGVLGPRTRDAIRTFQRKHGVAATGAVTTELLRLLSSQPG